MIFKIVTLFLVFMAVLAMFGRLRMPSITKLRSSKCAHCGRHKIGKGTCPCGREG